MRRAALLLPCLALVACDRITGEATQKILDAEAIGYACRVSIKTPEDCMKENEAQSPSSILDGWKQADKDISKKTLDPHMGKGKPSDENDDAASNEAASEVVAAPQVTSEAPSKTETTKKTTH
ncbi:MAG: hypothetical protein PHI29_00335 [Gallionella sp.]|nr:hypothetical protein [Gallionella sp.]